MSIYGKQYHYAKPFNIAASALRMEEPAAPITAAKSSDRAQRSTSGSPTVVAQRNKFDVEDAALVLSNPANADGVSPL